LPLNQNKMELTLDKHQKKGVLATILYIALLILFFIMVTLEIPDPIPVDKPVEVEIQLLAGSAGGSTSKQKKNVKQVEATPTPPAQKLPTQKESSVKQVTSTNTQKVPTKTKPVKKETSNPNALFNSSNNTGGSGNGSGTKNGDGGDGIGANSNIGGTGGDRVGKNSTRTLLKRAQLNYRTETVGKIVLDIIVKPNGSVHSAQVIKKLTTINDANLQRLCIKSAKEQLKYKAISGSELQRVKEYTFSFTSS